MAVSGAVQGDAGSYTWGNGWGEGTDQASGGQTTMSTADNPATGAGTDTASANFSGSIRRHVIAAATLNPAPPVAGTPATNVIVVNSTTITATAPAHAVGAVNVTVTNSDGQSDTLSNGYLYALPPTVTSVSPDHGALAGGTSVTVSGTDFQSGVTVTFDGTPAASVVFVNSTTLTVTTPAHALGLVDVVVANPDTQSDTLSSGFEYVLAPTVTSLSPDNGSVAGGTVVTVTGTGFRDGAVVAFDGVFAAVTFVSSTELTATAPAHVDGMVDVVVTNPDGQSGSLLCGYRYGPDCTAPDICWNGCGVTNNWSEAANWKDGSVPGPTDSVRFYGLSNKDATFDQAGTIAGLTIDSGYAGTLTLSAGLTNNGPFVQNTGTLDLGSVTLTQTGDWTYGGGTLTPGSSTVVFPDTCTITGTHSLANVTFDASAADEVFTIAAGTTLTVGGILTISGTNQVLLDTGDVHAQGDVTITNSATTGGGSATLTMNGTGAQTLAGPATSGEGKLPDLAVDKSSGTATLMGHPTVTGTLTITQGELAHDISAANSLTLEGSPTAVTVGAAGTWKNYSTSTSTITLAGDLSNAGTIDFNSSGGGCADPDVILLRSSDNATLRAWSGAGTFLMNDLDVRDQGGTAAITVYNGTIKGTVGANWVFALSCASGGGGGGETAEAVNSTSASGSSTLTWSHVVGSGLNRLLVVGADILNNGDSVSVSSVTLDGGGGGGGSCGASPTVYESAVSTTYSVPTGCNILTVKAWGAGGAGGGFSGGGGAGGGGGFAKS